MKIIVQKTFLGMNTNNAELGASVALELEQT